MNCPKCMQQFEGAVCPNCRVPVAEQVSSEPVQEGDGTGGVIPYKNPKALIAYYLGIVSGLPLIGLPFGIAAFVLGIMGLKARNRNPVIKGSAHAWIGIGCGGLFTVLWGLFIVGLIISLLVATK